jgi:hypothetical protein
VALCKIKNSKRKGMPCQECDTDYDIKTKSIAMEDALEAIGQTSPAEEQTKKRDSFQGCPSKGIYPRESPCSIRQLRLAGMASVFLYATSGRARKSSRALYI